MDEYKKKDKKDFAEATLEAKWVVDSETGEQYMLDFKSGQILARKNKDGIWVNPENK